MELDDDLLEPDGSQVGDLLPLLHGRPVIGDEDLAYVDPRVRHMSWVVVALVQAELHVVGTVVDDKPGRTRGRRDR